MNKSKVSETLAARLFLLFILVLCIAVSIISYMPSAIAEGVSTPTDSQQALMPEFSFKFRSANNWSNQAQEQLTITVVDKYQTGWVKVEVRIDDDAWDDVSSDVTGENTYKMNVWKNCTVTVRVTDTQGNRHTGRVAIDFFDFINPTVTAGIRTSLLHVEASDSQSGISGVKVNDMLFTTLVDGKLDVELTDLLKSYERFTVYAIDNAGNRSDAVVLTNPYYMAPTQAPTKEPDPTNTPKPTKKPSSSSGSSGSKKPTATPKVTATPEPEVTTAPMVTPYVVGPGQPFVSEANMGVQSMLYSAHTNKQFIEVTSRNGETYYLVIDYDKPIDAENELYETYFLNTVDDRDLLAVLDEDEIPTPTPTIVPTLAPTAAPVVTDPPEESKPDSSMMGIAVIGLIGLGAGGFWFMKNKSSNTRRVPAEVEYDEEDEENEDNEVLAE